jgi:hypothetical protein
VALLVRVDELVELRDREIVVLGSGQRLALQELGVFFLVGLGPARGE